MKADKKASKGNDSSLLRAKRLFLINSVFFICLLTIAAFLFFSGEEESAATKNPSPPKKEWSLPELAYLKGEMQALREYPGTMPKYEEKWVRKHSLKAIQRDRLFDGINKMNSADLAKEYFKGYTDRFNEYYDIHPAREFGYRYGVKCNPNLHGLIAPSTNEVFDTLWLNRERLEQTFNIPDEATWRLFCEAFNSGFVAGYRVIEKGVTVESPWDKIRLFDE